MEEFCVFLSCLILQYIKLAKPDPSSRFIVRPDPTRGSNLKARPDPSSILKSSARLELEKSRLDNISTHSTGTPGLVVIGLFG